MNKFGKVIMLFGLLTLMANNCKKQESEKGSTTNKETTEKTAKQNVLEQLYGTEWYHSREEDNGDVQVYRDGSYKFPPSRGGRTGFKLEKDGTFLEYGPGPTDKPTTTKGTWSLVENADAILVKMTKNGSEITYTLNFMAFENNILKLKREN